MTENQTKGNPKGAQKGGGMNNDVMREANKRWMETYSGPCIEVDVSVGSPAMARIFKRDFDMLSRNIHFISVLGRALLGEEESRKAEEYVANNLKNSLREINEMIAQTEVIMVNNSVATLATYQNPDIKKARITSPFAKQFIDLLNQADKYLLMLHTLWMLGIIDNDQRSQHEWTAKIKVKSVTNSALNMFKAMLAEMNARKNGAGTKTVQNYGKKKDANKGKEGKSSDMPPADSDADPTSSPAVAAAA